MMIPIHKMFTNKMVIIIIINHKLIIIIISTITDDLVNKIIKIIREDTFNKTYVPDTNLWLFFHRQRPS